jgi:hypothetical protein
MLSNLKYCRKTMNVEDLEKVPDYERKEGDAGVTKSQRRGRKKVQWTCYNWSSGTHNSETSWTSALNP